VQPKLCWGTKLTRATVASVMSILRVAGQVESLFNNTTPGYYYPLIQFIVVIQTKIQKEKKEDVITCSGSYYSSDKPGAVSLQASSESFSESVSWCGRS
jgi:hypothetical protein